MNVSCFSESVQTAVKRYTDSLIYCGDSELYETVKVKSDPFIRVEYYIHTYCGKKYDLYKLVYGCKIASCYVDGIVIDYDTPDANEFPLLYENYETAREVLLAIIRKRTGFTGSIVRIED